MFQLITITLGLIALSSASSLMSFLKPNNVIPYTGNIELEIRDDKKNDILIDLMESNQNFTKLPLQGTTLDRLRYAPELDLSSWIVGTLEKLDVSPLQIFKDLQDFKKNNLSDVLKLAQMNAYDFNVSISHNSYSSIKLMNFAKVIAALNITDNDFFNFVLPRVTRKFVGLHEVLDAIPMDKRRPLLETVFKQNVLNSTIEPCRTMIANFAQVIAQRRAIGTAISKNSFVTISAILEETKVDNVKVNLKTSNATYIGLAVTSHQGGYFNASSLRLESFTPVAGNYNNKVLKNCTYIAQAKLINVENVTNDNGVVSINIVGTNITDADFHLGAPLVCNSKLYGIASFLAPNKTLHFVTFVSTEINEHNGTAGGGGNGKHGKNGAQNIAINSVYLVCAFVLLKMM